MKKIKPTILVILDGWGIAPASRGNGITEAKTPNFNNLITNYPVMALQASGEAVGLSWGEMGNSEVGHLNLGSGRIIYQSLTRINKSIADGDFFKNESFLKAAQFVNKNNSALHLMGLVSNGGVHSHQDHLFALLDLCKKLKVKKVLIHAILDGRDTKRDGGLEFIEKLEQKIKESGVGQIVSLSGRFYAMDRDNHWDREEISYLAISEGKSKETFSSSAEAIKKSYASQIYDEEFYPTVITAGGQTHKVQSDDAMIFFNFRADRSRQLTSIFALPDFTKFDRPRYLKNLFFVSLTEYDKDLPVEVAFKPAKVDLPLAKIIADKKLNQLHAAETEKYAHVTFFFNGGIEDAYDNENRVLVPSPAVTSYDQKPEMSAIALTQKIVKEIKKDFYHFTVVNFAKADMVGHTGSIPATIKGVETADSCLGEIVRIVLEKNGSIIVTADHGNAEELINLQTGEIDKEHSTNPVPFIVVGEEWQGRASEFGNEVVGGDLSTITPSGILADVAPTILKIMKIQPPKQITGTSLV